MAAKLNRVDGKEEEDGQDILSFKEKILETPKIDCMPKYRTMRFEMMDHFMKLASMGTVVEEEVHDELELLRPSQSQAHDEEQDRDVEELNTLLRKWCMRPFCKKMSLLKDVYPIVKKLDIIYEDEDEESSEDQ